MSHDFLPPLRLFRPEADGHDLDAHALACRELLRPVDASSGRRGLEPFSRSWFEELEQKRYARNGAWLPRVLEFSRHAGETMLMLRPGLGSDAVQYQRHGVEVTIGSMPGDVADKVAVNFSLRGLAVRVVPAGGPSLPFHSATFDLAYVNALHASPPSTDELFRILRPGGKLFGLFPAKFGVAYWRQVVRPWHWRRGGVAAETPMPAATAAGLRQTFVRFENLRIGRRHFRRADSPAVLKFVPHDLAERLVGEVLVLRAFKPLRTAKVSFARAA